MFTINDKFYSESDFAQQKNSYQAFDQINHQQAIAVCVEDSFVWLTLCFYLKSHHISAMPIHPGIPLEHAKQLAEKAGCGLLIYQDLTQLIPLENTSENLSIQANQHAGLIQMSSGTTGEAKCILRSWADIDIEINSYCQALSIDSDIAPVIACPITHSYGLISGVMVALARGQMPTIITSINPKFIIKILRSYDKPLLYSSPVMLQGLARLWPKSDKLFAAMTSGSTLSDAVFEQIKPRVNNFYQQYGCSEAGCISISHNPATADNLGTPLAHITLETSSNPTHPTEIIARIETSVGIKSIHTQDAGFTDQNGHLHFVARLDDTIIVSGLNVYPNELENIILSHPKINDCVIFKIEDPLAGHRICLQYLADSELTPAVLRLWCSQHLAPFQIPQFLQPVTQIARMANSKVNRKHLAIEFQKASA